MQYPKRTRDEIDLLAEKILYDWKKTDPTDLKGPIDPEELAELHLGYTLEYDDVSNVTQNPNAIGAIFAEERPRILIDNSLLEDNQSGRRHFTVAHEIGHGVLHLPSHESQTKVHQLHFFKTDLRHENSPFRTDDNGILNRALLPNDTKRELTAEEWIEWQANTFSAGVLMPKSKTKQCFYQQIDMLGNRNRNREYIQHNWDAIVDRLSKEFGVSRQAMEIRLIHLDCKKIYHNRFGGDYLHISLILDQFKNSTNFKY